MRSSIETSQRFDRLSNTASLGNLRLGLYSLTRISRDGTRSSAEILSICLKTLITFAHG
jgi:hypothetical protein